MSRVKYVPNPAFLTELQQQPEHDKGMRTITKSAAKSVRAVAPHKTGYYKRRVKAIGTRIRTLDVMWHLVEYGSKNNRPYSPLRRGLRAVGIRFVPDPKPPPTFGPWRQRGRKGKRNT